MVLSNSKKRYLALAVTTSLFAMSAPAYAQLDEIIVTATKKEETLQDVSMSIAAFDASALEDYRIEGLEDIAQYTPGLYTYPAAANSNGLRISLRGVGTFDPQLGLDNKVAVYTDGVYLGKVVGLAFDSPDLARVEVLKGPQGTLYGRNAVAGAINLISARPDPTQTLASLEGEFGNYGALGVNGMVNMPLGDKAAIRVSAQNNSRDGWVKNLGDGNDFAGYTRFGVRGAIGVELSDDAYFEVAGDYNDSTNEPYFYQAFDINTPTSLFANAIVGATDERIEEYDPTGTTGDGYAINKGLSAKLEYDFNENHRMKLQGAWRGQDSERYVQLNPQANPQIIEGILNADVNPAPGLQSINGFASTSIINLLAFNPNGPQVRADYANFIPRSPINGLFQSPDGGRSPTVDGHSQYSLEATFNGDFMDGDLEYTTGLFYFDESTGTGQSPGNFGDAQDYLDILAPAFGFAAPGNGCVILSGLPNLPPAFQANCSLGGVASQSAAQSGVFAGIYAGLLADSLSQVRLSTGNVLNIETEAVAIYGQATYHVNDDIRLIGGLRYSDESKDGFQQNFSPFFRDTTDLLGNPILPQSGSQSFDSLDPQAIIEFDASDDMMFYASYSEAFRSGGFNASASQLPVGGATVGPDFLFAPENITAYEVGVKYATSSVQFNAAGFYYDIPDQQVTVSIDPVISTKRAIVNSPTEIEGFEADGQVALTDNLTARGAVTYVKGDVVPLISPNPAIAPVTRDGLQGTPKWSYSASLNYDGDIGTNKRLFGNVNYSHKDRAETTPFLYLTNQNLVSARIGMGFDMEGGEAYIALWGNNLLDDKYTVDALPFETFAKQVHVFGTPRTYGVTAGFKYK
ncbi:MAG: TonB-dependent receptor [Hellea sp.]|nr:TonB-dependent receptor [Hellea sp.]